MYILLGIYDVIYVVHASLCGFEMYNYIVDVLHMSLFDVYELSVYVFFILALQL